MSLGVCLDYELWVKFFFDELLGELTIRPVDFVIDLLSLGKVVLDVISYILNLGFVSQFGLDAMLINNFRSELRR